ARQCLPGAVQRWSASAGTARCRGSVDQAQKKPRTNAGLFFAAGNLPGSTGAAIEPLAVALAEVLLAQADFLRGHLDQLVVLDEVQPLFQRVLDRRSQL